MMRINLIFFAVFSLLFSNDRYKFDPEKQRSAWDQTYFVWNMDIASSTCTRGLLLDPFLFYRFNSEAFFPLDEYMHIERGDVVWIRGLFLGEFYAKALPYAKEPFILVVSPGDESFPTECGLSPDEIQDFLDNPQVFHVFAQNCVLVNHPKVTPIPIGIDFHTIAYKNINGGWKEKGTPEIQESVLEEIVETLLPTHQRKQRIFADFQHADNVRHGSHKRYLQLGEDRVEIFQKINSTGLVDTGPVMKRSDLWRKKGEYAFSVSPHGNGLDCHRTWEDLALGLIVIVKTSPLDPLYEGLPVVIVSDWSEITQENLEKWQKQYGDALSNPEYRKKLSSKYWVDQINTKRRCLCDF